MSLGFQQQIRVLHVDDDSKFTDLTKTFLEREEDRFTVETATSAGEGVEKIDDRPPDCVVSDYNMPGTDGLEFLQTVREEHPDLPFVLFTGKGSEEVASDAISAGATDYLQKQPGADQYGLLANRILNAVGQYRSEQRLAATREEYTTVFENAQNALLLVDVEDDGFRYQQCNPRAAALIGRDRTKIVGKRPREALGPENGTKVVGAYRKCVRQRESVAYTVSLDLPMGEVARDCEVTPVSSDAEIEKLVVEFRDVTEQRKRQRDLEKIETLFEHAQDSMLLVDAGEEFTVERVNPAWEDTMGLSEEQVQDQTPREILGEQTGTRAEAKYSECINCREPLQYEETTRIDGELTYWVRNIAPVVVDGTVEYIVGSTRNVTEQKERQQDLEQARDLMSNMEELADTGAWEYDSATGRLMVTDGTRRLYGVDPDADLPLEAALDAVHPDDRDRLADRLTNCLETGEPYEIEIRLTTGDGAQRWLTAQGERVSERDAGSVVRGYIRDITDEKARERQLTELNRVTQALITAETRQDVAKLGVEAASDVLDLQANAVHFSAADDTRLAPAAQTDELASLIGDAPPLPVADSIAGRVYRDGEPTIITDVRQDPDVHNPDSDLAGHLYLPLGDHGILIAASESRAAFDRQNLELGELLAGTMVAALDRVEREQAARQRQQELSLFFEESPLGAVQWDDELRFERLNDQAEAILGYSEAELRHEPWNVVIADEDRDHMRATVEKLLDADGGEYELNRTVRKDGELITCEWYNRVVTDADGDVASIFSKFRDVTDRETRKRELEEHETIIESLTDAVYVLDEEGQFTYVNDEFVELVGYDRETILGNGPSLIKDAAAVEQAERQLGRLLSSDGPETVTFEVVVQPRDGDPIVCEDHIGVLPYEGDQFNGSVGTLRDITDRNERERQLQRERHRYTTLFEMLPTPVLHARAEGGEPVVETVNPAFEDTFGYDAETIRDEPLQDYILPDEQADAVNDLNQQVSSGGDVETEVERETTEGTRTFRLSVSTRNTETEDLEGYAVYTDITERKEREQERERQYEAIFNQTYQFMGLLEPDGTLIEANEPALDLGGLDREDVIGKPFWNAYWWQIDDETQREVREAVERAANGEFVRYDVEVKGTDENVIIDFSIRPVTDEDGEVTYLIPEGRNISELKALQTREQELEQQNERLEEFASIVSHDLRSPLGVAAGHLDMAEQRSESEHLRKAADAVERSQALIDDLLTLAREGDGVDETERVGVAEVAESSWQTVETRQATLEAGELGVIEADPSRLQQLFENLYRNAVEHAGDDVTVSVGAIDDGFYVADTGPGIPASDREEIFQAGYSTNQDGTGFGLRIVDQVVDAHGWEIVATESEQGGARFEVTGVEFADR